jgi:superfamily I DNA and/or RNA helicase
MKMRARILQERAAALDAPVSILNDQLAALREAKQQQKSDVNVLKLTDEISELSEHLLPPVLKAQADLSDEALKELLEENDANILLDSRSQVSVNIAQKILKSRPLWLSSVQAASKRIPLIPGLFDVLVIDEATQCDLASAIPLMFRAKKVVIVGDDKQLKFIPNIGKAQDLNFMRLNNLEPKKAARFSQSSLSLFDAALTGSKCAKDALEKSISLSSRNCRLHKFTILRWSAKCGC